MCLKEFLMKNLFRSFAMILQFLAQQETQALHREASKAATKIIENSEALSWEFDFPKRKFRRECEM